jgi:hypothetical protein
MNDSSSSRWGWPPSCLPHQAWQQKMTLGCCRQHLLSLLLLSPPLRLLL